LAVALPNPGVSNKIEVFDFVDSTGTVTNLRSLTLNPTGKVYGLEFSGDKLFATLSAPGASRLYEFVFNAAGIPSEINPLSPPAPNNNPQSATVIPEELGAIQLGPDGAGWKYLCGREWEKLPGHNFTKWKSNWVITALIQSTTSCCGDNKHFGIAKLHSKYFTTGARSKPECCWLLFG
jgi:hypothetical protein